ncbi:MAG TPA: AAA family ATPase [Candidatus Saccharimonadales bacterium]|nr:AAA family ATPase [Candidatus Saccharimonadales bacterium]
MKADNLVGIAEIAEIAKVSRQVVSNWRHRYEDFPPPIRTLQSGPVWNREAVEIWLKAYKGDSTHVLSFINLKGGVGKTTTAVAVAELLAQEHRKRVLLVDLDPQTSATVSLIKEEKWAEMDREGRTIAQLFSDKLNPHIPKKFDIERAIARQVSTINDGIAKLDLLPSSIQLIAIQDKLPMIAIFNNYAEKPIDILKNAIEPILGAYDYVIIDCPPSLGDVTKNGLRISTGYLIPTIPDILSTWGIFQIVQSVKELANTIGLQIPPLGIIATKVQGNDLHRRVISDLRNKRLGHFGEGSTPQPPLLAAEIPQTVDVARGADPDSDLRTFKGKYGKAYEPLKSLVLEIRGLCEKKKH